VSYCGGLLLDQLLLFGALLFFVGRASSGIRAYLLLTLVVGITAACKQKHLFSVWTQLTVGTFFPLLLILLLMRF
jgi:hypothetical protein